MERPLPLRLGTFLILLGSLLIIIFIGSVIGRGFNFLYLLLGAISLFLGFSLRRRAIAPPTPSARFSTIHKLQDRSRTRREKAEQKKDIKK